MNNSITFKVALSQNHILVGSDQESISHNISEIVQKYKKANDQNCDVLLAAELGVTGYGLGDLMNRKDVQEIALHAEDELIYQIISMKKENNTGLVFGNFSSIENISLRNLKISIYNFNSYNALQLNDQALVNYARIYDPRKNKDSFEYAFKKFLPNWSVFDEVRWFASAKKVSKPIEINGVKVGVCICRDIWLEQTTRELVEAGSQIILVPNASPYANGRHVERLKVVGAYAKKYRIPIVYVNMISACDEVVFDGGSFAVDSGGNTVVELKRFETDFAIAEIIIDLENPPIVPDGNITEEQVDVSNKNVDDVYDLGEIYSACKLGLGSFINSASKNKGHVVVGLSGGIDSALVATLAVDALGSERVHGVLMPSKYTSDESNIFAEKLASNLGISCEIFSIENMHEVTGKEFDLDNLESVVSENIQSRLRGITLMMLSNSRGWLALASGNKSEIAVGYYTLYGDSVGAFAPIKDVYKTQVFELCEYRNSMSDQKIMSPIPKGIITRTPSAELRENQKDSDSLPDYKILDAILIAYVDEEKSLEEIIAIGYEKDDVEKVINLVKHAQFKRYQSPTGTRLTRHNFGLGRRIPISAN